MCIAVIVYASANTCKSLCWHFEQEQSPVPGTPPYLEYYVPSMNEDAESKASNKERTVR